MTREDLAALPEPKYLLYPNLWIYRGLMALPVIAFLAYLPWFVPTLLAGEANVWHGLFFGMLGLMTVGVLLPKSRDWRSQITFAATPKGAWFVTGTGETCVFVPWEQVGEVYAGDVRGREGPVHGVVFEIETDETTWEQLNRTRRPVLQPEHGTDGRRTLGLSANLRRPSTILEQVNRMRALDPDTAMETETKNTAGR